MDAPSLRSSLIRLAHARPEFRSRILALLGGHSRTAAKLSRLKMDVKLKDGTTVERGTPVAVEFVKDRPSLTLLAVEGREAPLKVSTIHLHQYLNGYKMPPSRAQLERWAERGICQTVTGKVVEMDGWAPDGSPAWFLVLGMI